MSPKPSKRTSDSTRDAADLKLDVARLDEAMANKGLNSARLADMIGLTRSSLTYFRNGKRQPSRSVLSELADKLSVTVDYLLGGSEESNTAELMKNPRIQKLVEMYKELTIKQQQSVIEMIQDMLGQNANPGNGQKDSGEK